MVLLTGATGFVGRHLTEKLLNSGIPLRALLRPGSQTVALKDLPVEKTLGNPFNVESLESALKGVEYVIHCAGVLKGLKYEDYYKGNVLYTENLLQAVKRYAPGLKKFIYVSTQAAAGPSANGKPKREEEEDFPISWYGLSKLSGEKKVKESGVPFLIFRPSGIYGPGDHEFFPLFRMAKAGFHVVVGKGTNRINLLHVFDLVNALKSALNSSAVNRTYYIADGREYTWRELLALVNQAVGRNAWILPVPRWIARMIGNINSLAGKLMGKPLLLNRDKIREGLQEAWVFDISRIRKELKFEPEFYPEEAFKSVYCWYQQEGWL